ncbi:protein-disulfide reductase DsbD N-terminal domain-containing protein [Pseudogulbenkiania sp. MAI-1]|uniref:protein-disulfide reductase DsbD N-terminal domain-containing protein n=1 Tax=Pseudogulbenkiania sp. MAI-1 TaxID=990370 RepID=UPI00045E73B0|nr:protein-disulfide reductase DsbD N-terminal domain-containing protein [Pseudogulbenkiania sp. MAI-1]
MRRVLLGLWLMSGVAHAIGVEQLLPPDKAFRLQAGMPDSRTILLEYRIAPGYYLYRDRFRFSAENASLGKVKLPDGFPKQDPTFGTVMVFANMLEIQLPLSAPLTRPMTLKATSQGCTRLGVCYVPYTHRFRISPDGTVTTLRE